MQRLITGQEVADFIGIDYSAEIETRIATAEAMIAAHIQTRDLYSRSVQFKQTIFRTRAPWELIVVRDGPISEVVSLTIDGIEIMLDSTGQSSDLIVNPWSIEYAIPIFAHEEVILNYSAGWTPESVPRTVKSAIAITAGLLHTNPLYTILERIGDYEIQRLPITKVMSESVDPRVDDLLRYFVRPMSV